LKTVKNIQIIVFTFVFWGLVACNSSKGTQRITSEEEIQEIWNHSNTINNLNDYFSLRNNLIDAYHNSKRIKWILRTEGYDVKPGEEWFQNTKDGKIWRLIPPSRSEGLWEPVQKEFLSKSCLVKSSPEQDQWDTFKQFQKTAPLDVAIFMERAKNCYHFWNEEGENKERKREIVIQEEIFKCSTIEQDRQKLQNKYFNDKKNLQAIKFTNDELWN
jgi:hypothetical protein